MSKTKEKRLVLGETPARILDEYCELYGVPASAAISVLIMDVLRKRLARARLSFGKNILQTSDNIRQTSDNPPKSRKKKASQIPDDFSPPRSIAEDEGLNYERALEVFVDWAKGKGEVKADWERTFRNACRGWIPERFPDLKKGNSEPEPHEF